LKGEAHPCCTGIKCRPPVRLLIVPEIPLRTDQRQNGSAIRPTAIFFHQDRPHFDQTEFIGGIDKIPRLIVEAGRRPPRRLEKHHQCCVRNRIGRKSTWRPTLKKKTIDRKFRFAMDRACIQG
jgi:hypothetical protein